MLLEKTNSLDDLSELSERIADLEQRLARQHEEWLHSSEQFLQQFLYTAPCMFWMADVEGRGVFFSKEWLRFRGRTSAQESGNGWMEGVHPEDLPPCVTSYRAAFAAREEFQLHYRIMRASGEYHLIVNRGVPRYLLDGSFAGYIGTCFETGAHLRKANSAATVGNGHGAALTDREKQVLVLIAQGNSTRRIADLLGISYKTADSHRSNVMNKLGVHETASVVRYAIRRGFVEA